MNTYKIYTLSNDGKTRKYFGIDSVNGDKFEFSDRNGIIEKVREMRKNSGTDYMWCEVRQVSVLGEDGKVERTYDTINDHMEYLREITESEPFYKKVWNFICRKWYRLCDLKWKVIYGFERMFKGYDRMVSWNIDSALFDMLIKNVSEMAKNLNGCPHSFVSRAVRALNPDISEEEANSTSGNREQIDYAMLLWKSSLMKLVENCKVFQYYQNFGIQGRDDEDWVDPLKYPIPHFEFSEETDYEKLNKLEMEVYEEIFKFLHDHLLEMWD